MNAPPTNQATSLASDTKNPARAMRGASERGPGLVADRELRPLSQPAPVLRRPNAPKAPTTGVGGFRASDREGMCSPFQQRHRSAPGADEASRLDHPRSGEDATPCRDRERSPFGITRTR